VSTEGFFRDKGGEEQSQDERTPVMSKEEIIKIAKQIVSIRSPWDPQSMDGQCQNCGDHESYKICSKKTCEGKMCSLCLLKAFEDHGYQNYCPTCQQFVNHDFYQTSFAMIATPTPTPESEEENEVRKAMSALLSEVCGGPAEEVECLSGPQHTVRSLETIAERWEQCLEIPCSCGEVHGLYPVEIKKTDSLTLQSLLRKIRIICGASAERQLQMLEILHRHTTGQVRLLPCSS
jgi:hypothetical protein